MSSANEVQDNLNRVVTALKGETGPDQLEIAVAGLHIAALVLRKNADYGNSALIPPVLARQTSPQEALRCRMSDKIQRICRLAAADPEVAGEGIADSIDDLAGYAILDRVLRVRANAQTTKVEETDETESTTCDTDSCDGCGGCDEDVDRPI